MNVTFLANYCSFLAVNVIFLAIIVIFLVKNVIFLTMIVVFLAMNVILLAKNLVFSAENLFLSKNFDISSYEILALQYIIGKGGYHILIFNNQRKNYEGNIIICLVEQHCTCLATINYSKIPSKPKHNYFASINMHYLHKITLI